MALKYVLEKEAVTIDRKALSVSQITRNIKALLEEGFTAVWVEGEVSNFKRHSSGHLYFSLKDEEAQLGCVMFRRESSALSFDPSDGMQILCKGRISVYEPRGQYQLGAERMEPKGLGALQIRFRQLTEKLRTEGLFDEGRKPPIPYLAKRIAIVTSRDGAALRDILNVLGRRFSSARLLICPVPVQGAAAAGAITAMIEDLNEARAADVMILARGGGSLEDLWAFNEESVARAIFHSLIPVISAVGHETDFTIADFVSDLRAPTPSAAAELVLPRREDLLSRIAELRTRALQSLLGQIRTCRETLEALTASRVLRDPLFSFEARFQRLDELVRHLGILSRNLLLSKKETASALLGKLEALGPLATLKRGFSVTLKLPGEKVVSSVQGVKIGDEVKTRLKDGFFRSRVTEVGP